MASTILTDFLSVGVVLFFVIFVYARMTHKELGEVANEILGWFKGGEKDEK